MFYVIYFRHVSDPLRDEFRDALVSKEVSKLKLICARCAFEWCTVRPLYLYFGKVAILREQQRPERDAIVVVSTALCDLCHINMTVVHIRRSPRWALYVCKHDTQAARTRGRHPHVPALPTQIIASIGELCQQ